MWLFVGIGGFIGSILRYGVSEVFANTSIHSFPYVTLTVNIIGSFFLAFLTSYFYDRTFRTSPLYIGICTGLIGSFTTFSTFSMETVQLWRENEYFLAICYVGLSIFIGLYVSYFGVQLGKIARKKESGL